MTAGTPAVDYAEERPSRYLLDRAGVLGPLLLLPTLLDR